MRQDAKLVLVADHEPASCARIVGVLEGLSLAARVVETGVAALAAASSDPFALVLLAVDLPEPCGFEVLHALRERFGPALPIALLGARLDAVPRDEIAALLLGADDYFCKPIRADRFLVRVRRLVRPAPRLVADGTGPTGRSELVRRPHLTPREHEVLALLSQGLRRSEIAERLCITGKTVATHIERILAKLGVHSQAQAVAVALRDRLVEPQPGSASALSAVVSSAR